MMDEATASASADRDQVHRHLVTVPGIGRALARSLLDAIPVDDLVRALRSQDTATLCSVPRVGASTARRLVEALHDRDLASAPPRKRRRDYTMSPAATAQRRSAAVKTGEHATSAARRAVPPCKRSACPNADGFPCSMRREVTEQGGALEVCARSLVVDDAVAERFSKALAGDVDSLRPLAARAFAAQTAHLLRCYEAIEDDKPWETVELLGKDGERLGTKRVPHPAVDQARELERHLGYTADAYMLTPKARGDAERDGQMVSLVQLLTRGRGEAT
ncbi:MAG: helix-hairpin-helix domain-containing protein [Acidobacteriota bacterium]